MVSSPPEAPACQQVGPPGFPRVFPAVLTPPPLCTSLSGLRAPSSTLSPGPAGPAQLSVFLLEVCPRGPHPSLLPTFLSCPWEEGQELPVWRPLGKACVHFAPRQPHGKQAGFLKVVFLRNVCSETEERTSLSATLGPLLGSVTHSPFRPHLLKEISEPPAQVCSHRVLIPLEVLLQVRRASSRTGPELCRGIFQECVGVGISFRCRAQIWALG